MYENDIKTLKATVQEHEQNNTDMNKKLTETLSELKHRSDKFYYAEKMLSERDAKIAKLESKLENTTKLMNQYWTEKD